MGDFDLEDLETDDGGDRAEAAAGVAGDEAGTAAAAAALDSDMAERVKPQRKHGLRISFNCWLCRGSTPVPLSSNIHC